MSEVSLDIWLFAASVALIVLILYLRASGTTFWDWLDLLVVPAAIAGVATIGGAWFTKRTAQDAALQAYLDKMSDLLIQEGLSRETEPYDDKRVTARARTLALLTQLNRNQKRTVVQFLREARLINKKEYFTIPAHIVGLRDADLTNANLKEMRLISSRGEAISLEGANLAGADLGDADLRDADLRDANLRSANLRGTTLQQADLRGADLRDAEGLTRGQVEQAILDEKTQLPIHL